MNGLKTGLIFGFLLIAFFAAGCLESADANSEQDTPQTEDSWRSDGIQLMQHESEGYYGCFGCSTPEEGPAMCIDPIHEMKKVGETEERYCNSNFEVIELNFDTLASEITNFEECVAAGYPVMESYPRQCRTADGETFVEVLEGQKSNSMGVPAPGFEGSDVVDRIVIDDSDGSVASVEFGIARAEILPPVPPTGGISSTSRGIHVSGQGKVVAVPDIVVFSAGVVTTGETAQVASQENAEAMDRVLRALKNLGIEDKDIKTQTVSVWPEYDYGQRDEGKRELPIIIGYRAENRVSVTVREVSMAGKAIDASVDAGANQVYGLSYSFSDEKKDKLYALALREAVADGTGKAKAIADAIGAEKITPVSVSESGGFYPPIYRMDMAEAAVDGGVSVPTPVSPGELEVSASVSMSFDFA
jgi:uncharacterized protein YggE